MKKTLVAAAALAVVGAASAQSSVTLYGRIDASLASQRTSNTAFVAGATTDVGMQLRSGAHTGSRWGLRGSEDLGGGLRALFQLEQGFNIDTGTDSVVGGGFNRQAFVGLGGSWGTLTVGRQYDAIDTGYANHDALGYSVYAALGYAMNSNCAAPGVVGTGDCLARANNSFQYAIPTMGGLNAFVQWAPGENKVPGVVGAGKMWGAMANYINGPITVGGAYQSNKATSAAPATTNWELGGAYDLSVAKVYLQFTGGSNRTTTVKDNGFNIGVLVPMGAISLMASYAREKQKLAGASLATDDGLSLMAQYALSKRTYVYGAYLNGERDPVAAGVPSIKQRNWGVGLVHNF